MSSSDGARKTAYHHGDLRAAFVARGIEAIERVGAAALSLRALAREIGVSPNAALHHFPSKQHLLAAIAAEGFRRMAQWESEAERAAPTAVGLLIGLATVYVQGAMSHPRLYRLMTGEGLQDVGSHSELRRSREHAFGYLDRALEQALLESGCPERFPVARAGAWSLVHGIASLAIDAQITPREGDLPDMPELVRILCSAYLRGLPTAAT